MSRTLRIIALFLAPFFAHAQVPISALPAVPSVAGTDEYPSVQGGVTSKATAAQIATYIQSVTLPLDLASANVTGVLPVAKVGAGTDTRIPFATSGVYADDADLTWASTTNTLRIAGAASGANIAKIEWQPSGDPNKFQMVNQTGILIVRASNQDGSITHPAWTVNEQSAGYVYGHSFDAEATDGTIAQLYLNVEGGLGYLLSQVGADTGVVAEERSTDGTISNYTLTVDGTGATPATLVASSTASAASWTLGIDGTSNLILGFNGATISSAEPRQLFQETDRGTDLKLWDFDVSAGVFTGRTRTDADGSGVNWISVTRGATTAISGITLGNATNNPSYTFSGNGTVSVGGNITAPAGGIISGGRIVVTSSSNPTNGMNLPGTNTIGFATNSTNRARINASGQLSLTTVGAGFSIAEGSNAKMGTCTLVVGTCTVSTTAVTDDSRIFLTAQSLGTVTVGQGLAVSARTAGTSFTVTSTSPTDTSVVAWIIFEPS